MRSPGVPRFRHMPPRLVERHSPQPPPTMINDPTSGRILIHGKGTGGIGSADIERRARELADIDGRSGAEITQRRRETVDGMPAPVEAEGLLFEG